MIRALVFSIGICLSACSHANPHSENKNLEALPLNVVLSSPHEYDKKTILVEGYLHSVGVDIDETGFYSFFPAINNANGLPICKLTELFISKDSLPRRLRHADRQKVVISARFNNTELEHQTTLFLHELVGSFDDVKLILTSVEQCVPH